MAERKSPFLTPERLRRLYSIMVRLRASDALLRAEFERRRWPLSNMPALQPAAVLAGCFSHLRAGDLATPAAFAFAANLAAEGGSSGSLGQALAAIAAPAGMKRSGRSGLRLDAAALAEIAGVALGLQVVGNGNIVAAVVDEKLLGDADAVAVLRSAFDRHLPLIVLTMTRVLPEPGAPQTMLGMPQIAVAGGDAAAVYRVMQESEHRARTGIGPTWIRCWFPSRKPLDEIDAMEKFLQSRSMGVSGQRLRETQQWKTEWAAARRKLRATPDADATEKDRSADGGEIPGSGLPIKGFNAGLDAGFNAGKDRRA